MSIRRMGLALALMFGIVIVAPAAAQITDTSVRLLWTAPGDDSLSGTATEYDLRWSTSPLTSQNFASGTRVAGVPAPLPAGASQSFSVTGLAPSTQYWFALKTGDERGNWSGVSNVVSGTTAADTERPAPLSVSVSTATNSTVTLTWAAVGDDSLTGTAAAYDVRWSTTAITEGNWTSANAANGEPAPAASGAVQNFVVTALDRNVDLYFAVKVRDDANQWSAISNSPRADRVLDTAPPSAPVGVMASLQSSDPSRDVRVRWSNNPEVDLAGYNLYRGFSQSGPFTKVNGSLVITNQFVDAGLPDSTQVWYKVSAVDGANNESARSSALRVWLTGGDVVAWKLQPAYPNPSSLGATVNLPLEVPAAGPFEGRVEVLNSAGERVRLIELRGLSPGPTQVAWDGRNEVGRETVPGVYRAWLVVGNNKQLVKLVRTP
ncbi:MAG: FlgD immunoglobulin-like domain containing protein [Candidatus Eisenbacteria bacterium]